jgi:hypothetical protein
MQMKRSSQVVLSRLASFVVFAATSATVYATCCTVATTLMNGNDPPFSQCAPGNLTVCEGEYQEDEECGRYPTDYGYRKCGGYTAGLGQTAEGPCDTPPGTGWRVIHRSGTTCCFLDSEAFNEGYAYEVWVWGEVMKCENEFCGSADPEECPPVEFPAVE